MAEESPELKELFKTVVNQRNNGDNTGQPPLQPTSSIRHDTEELRKRFFSDSNIKIMCYGDSGGGMYTFYLFRDDDNNMYDIYKIPSFGESTQRCYVSCKY